jgi:IS1 family transposase/transposase-like protein
MKCKYCASNCIKKGYTGIKQRYKCKKCSKYQLDFYTNRKYKNTDDDMITTLNGEGMSISGIGRTLNYSKQTIMRRILYLAEQVKKPFYNHYQQIYEVDEMCVFVKKNTPANRRWITYGIHRETKEVMDVAIGRRTKEVVGKVVNTIKAYMPKEIITDKLNFYPKLIAPFKYNTKKHHNNHIERANLTMRVQIKRLGRKTLCYSKSESMLEAVILLYFHYKKWTFGKA